MAIKLSVFATGITLPPQQIQWKNVKGEVYSPFEKRGYYHKKTIELQIPTTLKGEYYIGFKLESNELKRQVINPSNNQALTYFITQQTNTNSYILDWPMVSSEQNIIRFDLSGSNVPIKRIPIYIWVDAGQSVQPGSFTGSMVLNLYEGPFNVSSMSDPILSSSIPITIDVTNRIDVSLGSDTFNQFTDFKVKFDVLKEGATVKYDAFVNSFGNYKLQIKSQQKGVLTHQLEQVKTTIPYAVYLDNQLIQFDGQGEFEVRIEKGPNASSSKHEIKLVLGNASHAFKGDYGDKVSIKAIAE